MVPPRSDGRVKRRESILEAAIQVFGKEGYRRASVDEIARLAGVAKPTLYNRFGDKASLFVESVTHAAKASNDRTLDVIDTMNTRPVDLRDELLHVGVALVGCAMHPDGAAVMRLVMSEHTEFGDKFDTIQTEGRDLVLDRLAGKLAQLSSGKRLELEDPQRAARHFMALVNDDAVARSGYGLRVLTADDVEKPVADAVDTFLGAFGSRD